jgi:hypothetical protein
VSPVAALSFQSSLGAAIGDFWRIWGCRRGGFGLSVTGLLWIWDSGDLGCRRVKLSAVSGVVFSAIWVVGGLWYCRRLGSRRLVLS